MCNFSQIQVSFCSVFLIMFFLICVISCFLVLATFTQPVFVSRDDANSRQTTIKEIEKRATSNGEWPQVAIFAEGTCTNRKCLISFKQGSSYNLKLFFIRKSIIFCNKYFLRKFFFA